MICGLIWPPRSQLILLTSQNAHIAGQPGLQPWRPTSVLFQPRPTALEANSSFILRSFITYRAICSLSSIDGARLWYCLSLSSTRSDLLRRNYRAGAARQAEKRSRPRLRPQSPTSTLLKPSRDQEGPPCQVWGQWDQRCGRALITHTHTQTNIWQIYTRMLPAKSILQALYTMSRHFTECLVIFGKVWNSRL